jgi:two-component system, NtrC family, response regulator
LSEKRILIIDDEADVCNFFRRLLSKKSYQVTTATNQSKALQALSEPFNLALVDLKLPDTDGLTLLRQIKTAQPGCEVIIMTGFSTVKTAVQAMQLGAYEYIEKPFDEIEEIEALVAKAVTHGEQIQSGQLIDEDWAEIAERIGFFVGQSQLMRQLVSLAYKISVKNINVLIQGNTGSGKEVLARFIHLASPRANQPFIAINCGAISENLLESELFGHERGSFTGASQTRHGIFELAHRGTLFLDEIGDASPAIQVKLLRVLETGEFRRVGGERAIKTDVRIISATNVDLDEAIHEKTFREDLFYRLNVVHLEIPALTERSDDIPALSTYLIQQYNPELALHPQTMQTLCNYNWPGNIRELANCLRRAAALCDGKTILIQHLASRLTEVGQHSLTVPDRRQNIENSQARVIANPEDFWAYYAQKEYLQNMSPGELNQLLLSLHGLEKTLLDVMISKGLKPAQSRLLKEFEIESIKKNLEENRWNITATAKALGIARNTLHRKIKLYGLQIS